MINISLIKNLGFIYQFTITHPLSKKLCNIYHNKTSTIFYSIIEIEDYIFILYRGMNNEPGPVLYKGYIEDINKLKIVLKQLGI